MRSDHILRWCGTSFLITISVVCCVRLILPVKILPITKDILSKEILPPLYDAAYEVFGNLRGFELSFINIFKTIWFFGVLFLLERYLYNIRYFYRLLSLGKPQNDPTALKLLKQLQQELHMSCPIDLIEISGLASPAVITLGRKRILLPKKEYSSTELAFIFKHELYHLRYYDLCWKTLFQLLCILYWWNPVMPVFQKRFSELLELRVDQAVTKSLSSSERMSYMECLITCAKNSNIIIPPITVGICENNLKKTKQRLAMIYHGFYGKQKLLQCCIIVGITVIMFFFLPEPSIPFVDPTGTIVTIAPENAYFVEQNNQYNLYVNGKLFCTLATIPEDFKNLDIYRHPQQP
ncbi:MAG: M56 family metallopeptidase [Lachnospiraceae bacterium]|nr:M56 family metallopeptidase [Lachnospiraceae bacterium]